MTSMIQLLTRADDLGSFSGVLPAVLGGLRSGVLRNASVMVPTRWFADAGRHLRGNTDVCLGVHLTVCCEWTTEHWRPIADARRVPSLVDEAGRFLSDPRAMHTRGVRLEHLLAECQAQLDLARAHGLDPRYADTHMAWEWMHEPDGTVRAAELLPDWCRRNGLRWHRDAQAPGLPRLAVPQADLRGDLLARSARASGPRHLAVWHPCQPSAAIAAADLGRGSGHVQADRAAEATLIADPHLCQELDRLGVVTTRYDDVC